jgi:hypothetical protein
MFKLIWVLKVNTHFHDPHANYIKVMALAYAIITPFADENDQVLVYNQLVDYISQKGNIYIPSNRAPKKQ